MKNKIIRVLLATAGLAGMAGLWAQSGGFKFNGPIARVITPNGDGRNDFAIFCLDNPSDSDVDAKIFTMLGSEVARLERHRLNEAPLGAGGGGPVVCPAGVIPGSPQYVSWNGTSNGSTVKSGVYVYQLKAEGLTFTGTLLVVR